MGAGRTRRLLAGAAAVAVLAGGVAAGAAAADSPHGHGGHHDGEEHELSRRQVLALVVATARFHSVNQAVRSGRDDLNLCFDQMGEHFADAPFDNQLDPLAPEAMVYEHRGGHLRLVAVEWVSTEPGEVFGIPLHLNEALGVWVLHAWVWKHNPDGMLADFNPRVGDCPD